MTQWIEIGTLQDIPRQGARVVRTALGDIAVFRTADDVAFAGSELTGGSGIELKMAAKILGSSGTRVGDFA